VLPEVSGSSAPSAFWISRRPNDIHAIEQLSVLRHCLSVRRQAIASSLA
jgi:hypothetical protein